MNLEVQCYQLLEGTSNIHMPHVTVHPLYNPPPPPRLHEVYTSCNGGWTVGGGGTVTK